MVDLNRMGLSRSGEPIGAGYGGAAAAAGASLRQVGVSEYPSDGVVTFNVNVVAGDVLIVTMSTDIPSSCAGFTPSISSSPTNTWNSISACNDSRSVNLVVFYAVNVAGGATTITVGNLGTDAGVAAYDFNVNGVTNPFDTSSVKTNGGSNTTLTTDAFTVAQAHSLVFVAMADELTAQSSVTPGSGFTIGQTQPGHVDGQAYNLDSASGSQTASMVVGNATITWVEAALVFKTF